MTSIGSSASVAIASFAEQKDLGMLKLFDSSASITSYAGSLNLSFYAGPFNDAGGFDSSQVLSGNVPNSPSPVPIPAAVWLLGSGLIGLVGMRRRIG